MGHHWYLTPSQPRRSYHRHITMENGTPRSRRSYHRHITMENGTPRSRRSYHRHITMEKRESKIPKVMSSSYHHGERDSKIPKVISSSYHHEERDSKIPNTSCRTALPMHLKEYACGHLGLTWRTSYRDQLGTTNHSQVRQEHQHSYVGHVQGTFEREGRKHLQVIKSRAKRPIHYLRYTLHAPP